MNVCREVIMISNRALASLILLGILLLPGLATAQDASPGAEGTPMAEEITEWPHTELGIVYGDDAPDKQIMHAITQEPRESPRPAVVLIHGGGLVFGEPADMIGNAGPFVDAGFVTFSIGYRLFNEATGANQFPAALDDVQLAMRWIRAHADEFNVDPDRIAAVGPSTGGHLAGLLGTMETRDPSAPLQEYSSRVTCVVSVSGDLDLTVPFEPTFWAPLYAKIMGGSLEEHPELHQAASPVFHVDADTVPFMMAHGTADIDSPYQQSRNMVAALTEAEIEYVYAEFPGKDHGGVIGQPQTWDLALTFVEYQLHPER
jgi:acetyl esterase/lipase